MEAGREEEALSRRRAKDKGYKSNDSGWGKEEKDGWEERQVTIDSFPRAGVVCGGVNVKIGELILFCCGYVWAVQLGISGCSND